MAKYIWKGIVDKEQNTFKAIQIDITDSTYILDNRVVIFDEQDPKNPFGSNIFDESDLKRVIRSGRSHLIINESKIENSKMPNVIAVPIPVKESFWSKLLKKR